MPSASVQVAWLRPEPKAGNHLLVAAFYLLSHSSSGWLSRQYNRSIMDLNWRDEKSRGTWQLVDSKLCLTANIITCNLHKIWSQSLIAPTFELVPHPVSSDVHCVSQILLFQQSQNHYAVDITNSSQVPTSKSTNKEFWYEDRSLRTCDRFKVHNHDSGCLKADIAKKTILGNHGSIPIESVWYGIFRTFLQPRNSRNGLFETDMRLEKER